MRRLSAPVLMFSALIAPVRGEAEDRPAAIVAQLDTLQSVYNPAVGQMAACGSTLVPYLLEKLESPRLMTALGAAWVFRRMASGETYFPLLEQWAKARNAGGSTHHVATAIAMTLEARNANARPMFPDTVDADLELISRSLVCREDLLLGRGETETSESGRQILVFGEYLNSLYDFSCFDGDVRVVTRRFPSRDEDQDAGIEFISITAVIHDLADSGYAMPEWEALMGCRPDALALVSVWRDQVGPRHHGKGDDSVWARYGGRWRALESTGFWIE